MKVRSAAGPDFWSVTGFKNLPDEVFGLPPSLFACVETQQCWPDAMLYGFCSLIPKEAGDVSPLGQRPLGVMSVLYRLYAAFRLQDVIQWQESVLHDSQFGFRPGHSTDDVHYSISLSIEEALLNGSPLIGLHFDYRKAFDLVPCNILFKLADRLGLSPVLLSVMQNMYSGLQRFFKIPGGLSTPFKSTCGILQGCPLSVVFMNVIVSIWAKVLSHESAADPRAFADDSTVLSNTIETAQDALDLTGEFAMLTKQELAHKKTVAWATTAAARQALRRIRYQGHQLQVFFDVKSLGAQLCSSKGGTLCAAFPARK
eukprot:s395_g30.t1